MAGWHHWLDGYESEWTPGVGDGQGGLACCDSWGRKESDTTERLNWTELNWMYPWASQVAQVVKNPSASAEDIRDAGSIHGSGRSPGGGYDNPLQDSCLEHPMDCSPPGSFVHGLLQVRILEWVAIPFSRGSSWPMDWTWVSCTAGRYVTIWATREAPKGFKLYLASNL